MSVEIERLPPWSVVYRIAVASIEQIIMNQVNTCDLDSNMSNIKEVLQRFGSSKNEQFLGAIYQKEFIETDTRQEREERERICALMNRTLLTEMKAFFGFEESIPGDLISVIYDEDTPFLDIIKELSQNDPMDRVFVVPKSKIPNFYEKNPKKVRELRSKINNYIYGKNFKKIACNLKNLSEEAFNELSSRDYYIRRIVKPFKEEVARLREIYRGFGSTRQEAMFFAESS
ncbi:hypothetical protein HYW75_02540 [Candidatus Pacearchaeota archaeon]|nr:hypothetical protein [Candidatus Pacearchaeota archaeon]